MKERRGLPLARASSTKLKTPDAAAIEKLFSIATNPEVAHYFREQLATQVNSLGMAKQFKEVMSEVDRLVEVVDGEHSDSSAYWSGEARDAAVSHFINFQRHLSEAAMESLQAKFKDETIRFDFAINDASEVLQGFSTTDGTPLNEEETDQVNTIFSAWLTERGMLCFEGVIYESAGEEGTPKMDARGNLVRVDPERYKQLFKGEIGDKPKGFAKFVEEFVKERTNKKLNVIVNDVTANVFPGLGGGEKASR